MSVYPSLRERLLRKLLVGDGCWEWQGSRLKKSGYGHIRDGHRLRMAHRVAWEVFFGPIPEGMNVLHSCDNPPCCRPNHLFLGTLSQNAIDREQKGRGFRRYGADNPSTKLTPEQVREIRRRYNGTTVGYRTLAKDYGVVMNAIRQIIKREAWAHVD